MPSDFQNEDNKKSPKRDDFYYNDSYLKTINEELYKRNVELAVKNKTLSLLQKLYEVSVLALEPKPLITKVTKLIQNELEFELVQVLLYDRKRDILKAQGISISYQFKKVLKKVLKEVNFCLEKIIIKNASSHYFFAPIVLDKRMNLSEGITAVFSGCFDKNILDRLSVGIHIKTILAYPLIIENEVIGILILAINRSYQDLSEFERQSVSSFINVIAVALDRAFIYQKLKTTNRKLVIANERLKELDKLKSEFISIASHQLRGPLTVIKGYISMILEESFGKVNSDIKKALNDVYYSNEKMIGLVNELLNASRVERGTVTLIFKEGDLNKFTADIIKELEWKAKQKKIDLSFHSAKIPTALFDSDKMRHAIYNVIDNAIKYTDKGKVEVFTKLHQSRVQIIVKDTGIGVTQSEKKKLFKRFTRGDEALRLHPEGTGLGLFLVKQIVEGHQGKVWVESKGRYKGSTFIIEIPVDVGLKKAVATI